MKLPDKIEGLKRATPTPAAVGAVADADIPDAHKPTPETVTAAGARSDARGEIAAVAEKVNPLAVDYGQTAYDAETGTVYWVAGDGTSNDELEQAREAFLAIDGVERFEYEAEGMPSGWCGSEVVYGGNPFEDECSENAALLEVLRLASTPLPLGVDP